MIYLATHRVTSSKGRSGINCFLHESPGDLPRTGAGVVDLQTALAIQPGELLADKVEVAPGGNSVQSYLDIVALDRREVAEIEDALTLVRDSLQRQPPPVVVQTDAAGVQFYTRPDLHNCAMSEFDALKQHGLELLRGGEGSPWRRERPLVILVRADQDVVVYQLDEESAERMQRIKGAGWRPGRIRIERPVHGDIAAMLDPVWPQLSMLLTGMDPEDLLPLGGVRFRDSETGSILHEWPRRAPDHR